MIMIVIPILSYSSVNAYFTEDGIDIQVRSDIVSLRNGVSAAIGTGIPLHKAVTGLEWLFRHDSYLAS